MALKEVAVQGMTIKFQNPSHLGTITISGSPSTKVFADNKGIYLNNLSISIASGTDGIVTDATGSGTMIATSIANLVENQIPLRIGDVSIPITMTGTPPEGSTSPTTYVTIVEIDDPGQTKVTME